MGNRNVGRRGLALNEVRQLERLIAAGLDRQTILKRAGVSAKTLRKAQQQSLPAQQQQSHYGRCEHCGVWVKLPCVLCQVKKLQRCWSAVKLARAKRTKSK